MSENNGHNGHKENEDDRMVREILEEAISNADETLSKAKKALAEGKLDLAAGMYGLAGISLQAHAGDLKTALQSRDLKKKRSRRERRAG